MCDLFPNLNHHPLFPILMYHNCPADFDLQLEYITEIRRLAPVHLNDEQVKNYLLDSTSVPFPKDKIVITFDDAYQDFSERTIKELLSYNCKATLCIATGDINDHEHKEPFWTEGKGPLMVWPEIQKLCTIKTQEGHDLLGFVPHSVSHTYFNGINAEQIRSEIVDSRQMLAKQLGLLIDSLQFFCFPGGIGEGNLDIQKLLCEAGYIGALRAHASKSHGWSRYSIPRCEPTNLNHLKLLLENANGFECN